MLKKLGRILMLAVAATVGCNDVTIELAPKPAVSAAGKGGMAGTTAEGSGGEAALGTMAGTGGRAASGGFGNTSDGGSDDGPGGSGACGPTGCAGTPGCVDSLSCKGCKNDDDCGPSWHCDVQHFRCVECRSPDECPLMGGCESDCPLDRSQCDWATNTCRKPCGGARGDYCGNGQVCNYDRYVCVECNFSNECQTTGRGQVCLWPQNICAECAVAFNSASPNSLSPNCEDPDRPICRVSDFACHACEYDGECGSKNGQCDRDSGRCAHPQPQP